MSLDELLTRIEESRNWFLKLVDGLSDEQWGAKPYEHVKSPRETIEHLIVADRSIQPLFEGIEPNYESLAPEPGLSPRRLLEELAKSHAQKIAFLRGKYSDADIEAVMDTVYSGKQKIGSEIASIAYEDWYHIGQVSLIRQGTDPDFEYYGYFYS